MPTVTCSLQEIDPTSIDLDDKTYLLAPDEEYPAGELSDSIRAVGILHPPLVQWQQADGFYQVLSGRKRIMAAQQLAPGNAIICLIIPADTSPADGLVVLAHHLRWGEPPSIIELAVFLEKAQKVMPEKKVLKLLPLFGHKPQPYTLQEITSLLRLEPSVRRGLHRGTLHPKAGKKLARLPTSDQQNLAELIEELGLGGSKQQKIIEMCLELIGRQKLSIADIIEQWRQECRMSHDPDNVPQNISALFQGLLCECLPRSTAAAEDFQKFVTGLKLPANALVQHAPSFESDETSLTFTFADKEALREFWQGIKEKAG